jgi:hypothetical protein
MDLRSRICPRCKEAPLLHMPCILPIGFFGLSNARSLDEVVHRESDELIRAVAGAPLSYGLKVPLLSPPPRQVLNDRGHVFRPTTDQNDQAQDEASEYGDDWEKQQANSHSLLRLSAEQAIRESCQGTLRGGPSSPQWAATRRGADRA